MSVRNTLNVNIPHELQSQRVNEEGGEILRFALQEMCQLLDESLRTHPRVGKTLLITSLKVKQVKLSPQQAVKADRVVKMLSIPHCLDNGLTNGGTAGRPTHRPHSTPQKHYFSTSGTHFC
jgi:hypothetical protein